VRALLLLVSACWSGSEATAPTTPEPPAAPIRARTVRVRPDRTTCDHTIGTLADKLRPELAKSGISEVTLAELVEVAIESCRMTRWSAEVLVCYEGITDANALTSCQALMSTDQSDDLSRRMMDVISRMAQLPPPPNSP